MGENRADYISYDEFIKRNLKPMVRPCMWKWEDMYEELQENTDSTEGTVALVNTDVADSGAISPNLNALVQVLKPGVKGVSHRHSNVAMFFVVQGEGYSVIDGETFEWSKGDIVLAPAWAEHGHANTSETEDAILLTIQDVPQLTDMGVFFLEEPVGEPTRHIVGKREKD